MDKRSLGAMLTGLADLGCHPSIYRRGKVWRAHINMAGNCWAEADRPADALRFAIEAWEARKRPVDGAAVLGVQEHE